ncbi:MAG: Na(+)-translocating NADH-quinone reductase subunit C [Pseudomonadales bacterium]|nr:Na(+)-translocating NADH-quinone reductase subunit C [Pseudomonadales bacterium]
MSNDSVSKTIIVATLLCLVCSVIVSVAAVSLKPIQKQNKLLDKQKNILAAAGLLSPGVSVKDAFEKVEVKLVNVSEGRFATESELADLGVTDLSLYNQRRAAKTSGINVKLPSDIDTASIHSRAKYAAVYLYRDSNGGLDKIILPIHGYGLWSTLYGFIALENDLNTVAGLGFYEHAETPGLGGEVDNPRWKAQWPGKQVYKEDNSVGLRLKKGGVDASKPQAIYQVDALAGASLTSRGVTNLVQFWMGNDGFGLFLNNIRGEGV